MSRVNLTNQPMRYHIMHRPTLMIGHRTIPESRANKPGRCRAIETRKSTRYAVIPRHRIPAIVQEKTAIPLYDSAFKQELSSNAGSFAFNPDPSAPLKRVELRAVRTITMTSIISSTKTRPSYLWSISYAARCSTPTARTEYRGMTSSRIHVVEVVVTLGCAIEQTEATNNASENIADAVRNSRVELSIALRVHESGDHILDRFGRWLRLTMRIPYR
jgi:hypothetical protein